jgi:hypothetical protein
MGQQGQVLQAQGAWAAWGRWAQVAAGKKTDEGQRMQEL